MESSNMNRDKSSFIWHTNTAKSLPSRTAVSGTCVSSAVCQTPMYRLVHWVVCLLTSQLLLVLTASTHWGWLSSNLLNARAG